MIHSKKQKRFSILFSFVIACITAILGFVGLLQPAKSFSVMADDTTATTATYKKVTTAPTDWSGEYLIVYEDGSLIFDGSLTKLDATSNKQSVTIETKNDTENEIKTINAEEKYSFTIASMTSGYSIQAKSGKYIGNNSDSNSITSSDSALANTITVDADGNATIKSSGGAYLRYNKTSGQTRFRYYKSTSYTNQQAIQLYKKEETGCKHETLTGVSCTPNADNTTHTVTGTCKDCGETNVTKENVACEIDTTKTITYNKNENDTHTMTGTCVCGRSLTSAEIACDHTTSDDGVCVCGNIAPDRTVTYSVWGNTTTDNANVGDTYTLKTITDLDLSTDDAYGTFIGWTDKEITDNVQTKPTTYTQYPITNDVTFYAVFQGKGNVVGGYTKVTENLTDWSGEYLIVYEDGGLIFDGSSTSLKDGKTKSVNIKDNKIEDDVDAYSFTIAGSGENCTIQSKSGYYIGTTSNSNGLNANKNTKYTNTIEIDTDGNATIKSSGGAYLRYNNTANIFRYYKSSSYTGQKAIQLYKSFDVVGDIYYTKRAAAIDTASVSLDGDIGVNYYVKALTDEETSLTMRFTVGDDAATTVSGEKQADGRYKFTVLLSPQRMADNIKAELLQGDVCIDARATFSVRAYASELLNKEDSADKLKTLLSELLRYGAAAQTYTEYKADDLATSGVENLTDAAATEIPEKAFTLANGDDATAENCQVWIVGAGIRFDYTNRLYVRLSDELPDGYTLTYGDSDTEMTKENGLFYSSYIMPEDYDEDFVITLKNGDVVLQTLTISINACLYNAANGESATDAEKAFALATYNFGVAAKAYKA